ncbi:uncharacterized protein Bfra_004369 [Botrytis fragariae]|uniref:F-box domain-containing protein n=1 Tax=Botrytis fragariae TaxID=1964551 RepID=A0A8H6EJD4_9HELO|nr:uncharacterized protein Bfra_004369 [Botrytis fragariae]KAF5874364.1 hypothetical protein Bfra_004369 [Botrytis fragariae]
MSTECKLLAKIWCSPTPTAPAAKVLHTACLLYLESIKLSTSCSSPEPRTLESLPAEIQYKIIGYLGFMGKTKLRQTNHFYNTTIPAPTPTDEELRELILATESEDYATSKQLLACNNCLRLRHVSKFRDTQTKGKRIRNGPQRHLRLCLQCAIWKGWYRLGKFIKVYGEDVYICRCRRATPKANLPSNWIAHKRCADCFSEMEKSRQRREESKRKRKDVLMMAWKEWFTPEQEQEQRDMYFHFGPRRTPS